MALSLKIRGVKRAEIRRRVDDTARVLHLEDQLNKRPRELSGGQRQRVAMGRAIIREPKAFLMDEPLSNLDAKLRGQMRSEILRLQRQLQVTTIYVTHDQTEATTLGDLVAVMRGGVLQQLASPQELYTRPANLFVGGFIGSPAMNLVEAKLSIDGGMWYAEFAGRRLRVPDAIFGNRPTLAAYDGRAVVLGIRPEHMEDAALVPSEDPDSRLPILVDLREDMSSDVFLHFAVESPAVVSDDTVAAESARDRPTDDHRARFIARAGPETTARMGERREIHVDTRRLYFFDPDSGESIGADRTVGADSALSSLTG